MSVEVELGYLGCLETGGVGKEDGMGAVGKRDARHDVDRLGSDQGFLQQTGVDALAIVIGIRHSAYKFSCKPTGAILARNRIAVIRT